MQNNAEEEEQEGFLCLPQRNAELQRCRGALQRCGERQQHQQHSWVMAALIILQNSGSCCMPYRSKACNADSNTCLWEELRQWQHGIMAVPDMCSGGDTCYAKVCVRHIIHT